MLFVTSVIAWARVIAAISRSLAPIGVLRAARSAPDLAVGLGRPIVEGQGDELIEEGELALEGAQRVVAARGAVVHPGLDGRAGRDVVATHGGEPLPDRGGGH